MEDDLFSAGSMPAPQQQKAQGGAQLKIDADVNAMDEALVETDVNEPEMRPYTDMD